MIDFCPSPESYAAQLAKYISDPSKIRSLTMYQWGRAPSLERCRALRDKHVKPKRDKEIARIHEGEFKCGHSRAELNTYWTESGTQTCKTCRREMQRRAHQRRRDGMRARERLQKLSEECAKEVQMRTKESAEVLERIATLNTLFFDELVMKVAHLFALTPENILGESRARRFVLARVVIVRLALDRGASRSNIAKKMNRKCHSSIIHLEQRFDGYARLFPMVQEVYDALKQPEGAAE